MEIAEKRKSVIVHGLTHPSPGVQAASNVGFAVQTGIAAPDEPTEARRIVGMSYQSAQMTV